VWLACQVSVSGRVGSAPLIIGWFNIIVVQSGDTVMYCGQVI